MKHRKRSSRWVARAVGVGVGIALLLTAGCSDRRCRGYYRGGYGGFGYCPPARPAYGPGPCGPYGMPARGYEGGYGYGGYDDGPRSWTRIEGDVYTPSYLDSLYRYQNDY